MIVKLSSRTKTSPSTEWSMFNGLWTFVKTRNSNQFLTRNLHLVGGWATPLKNMSSSIGMIIETQLIFMGKCPIHGNQLPPTSPMFSPTGPLNYNGEASPRSPPCPALKNRCAPLRVLLIRWAFCPTRTNLGFPSKKAKKSREFMRIQLIFRWNDYPSGTKVHQVPPSCSHS